MSGYIQGPWSYFEIGGAYLFSDSDMGEGAWEGEAEDIFSH